MAGPDQDDPIDGERIEGPVESPQTGSYLGDLGGAKDEHTLEPVPVAQVWLAVSAAALLDRGIERGNH